MKATLLTAALLGGLCSQAAVLMDYDDGLSNGVHEAQLNDGDFSSHTNYAGAGITSPFSALTAWFDLAHPNNQGYQGFRKDYDIDGSGGKPSLAAELVLGGACPVFAQDLAYTIRTNDQYVGRFLLRGSGLDPGDDFVLTLFYTHNDTLTGTPVTVFSHTVPAAEIANAYTAYVYTTGEIAAHAVGRKLMYRFQGFGGSGDWMFSDNHYLSHPVSVGPGEIPDTSHLLDVTSDPENLYSGAPLFDWPFFGGRTRIMAKYASDMPNHRHLLGVDYVNYSVVNNAFNYPPSTSTANAITDLPLLPTIQYAQLGKINATAEDGERPLAHDLAAVRAYMDHYPNLLLGGGQVAELDGVFWWMFPYYYGRTPLGPGGRIFPAAWFDDLEAVLKRSPTPYLVMEYNEPWSAVYWSAEHALSKGGPQLFYRSNSTIAEKMTAYRSAFRQYPHPFSIQFSGQPGLTVSNLTEVLNNGAEPVYTIPEGSLDPNYGKSYALARQMLYYAWLQGARSFNYEGGEWVTAIAAHYPSPLGTFGKKADDFIAGIGPAGPVDTPVAVLSEFSNTWKPPLVDFPSNKRVQFLITGKEPYALGDYQLHGLHDFFMPNYLQCEWIYSDNMMEHYALPPTPYGDCADYVLSNVREEALSRYRLLLWGGVPPEAPSVVREKLVRHISERQGRVVLFAAAARSLFPELFSNAAATTVAAGTPIAYGTNTFAEAASFTLEHLASTSGMQVLATAGSAPLIVETLGGLVLVLSDYGMNRTQYLSPDAARWDYGQLVTQIPYKLLTHAKRLLEDEVSACVPFTAGNTNLHFVVTRPQAGEYLVGLFNDKMTSEPFDITSRIGPITSRVEVALSDNQAELKATAGGAAYAPPGLRTSPDLPLDYGLSDASHIEGRDFRLFRLLVAETEPRPFPSIHFPARPVGRVLAVPGLGQIRAYLQAMPSFFQWFDGVEVEARELLATDDGWLAEQAHWLDRRGVRVVADADGLDETHTLAAVAKLALIDSGLKNLVVAAPSPAVQSAAAAADVALTDPADVHRVCSKGDQFAPSAALNILGRYYRTEEDLFVDLRHFRDGTAVAELRGAATPVGLYAPLAVGTYLGNDFLYVGPSLDNLGDRLLADPAGFGKFRGVKIDSTYLLARTTEALLADKAVLDQLGLELLVDLRRDQMHFDRITWYPHIPNYASGTNLYAEVVRKMQLLGSTELILTVQDVGNMGAAYIAQREATLGLFANLAASRNINLHLIVYPGHSTSVTSRPTVFVLQGSGTASPFKLALSSGNIGTGAAKIYDDNGGLYATAYAQPLSVWTRLVGGSAGGLWGTSANWSGGVPNAAQAIADFSALDLSAPSTVTNEATRTVGALRFGDTSASHDWTLTNASLTLAASVGLPCVTVNNRTATLHTVLTGTQGLVKSGAGTLALAAVNTFTGGTTVDSGTLRLVAGKPAVRGAVTVNSGATLSIGGNAWEGFGATAGQKIDTLNLNGGTLSNMLGSAMIVDAAVNMTAGSWSGSECNWRNTTLQSLASATPSTFSGALMLRPDYAAPTLRVTVADGAASADLTISGVIKQSTPSGNVVKQGAGTLVLTGANSYTGATTINEGTLQLGNGGTSGSLSAVGALTNNGTLVFNRSDALTQGTHFSAGVLCGTGGVIQAGGGITTLNAANTFSGAVVVSNGVLRLAQASALSATNDVFIVTTYGAKIDLPFAGTAVVRRLYVDGIMKDKKTMYGPSNLSAAFSGSLSGYLYTTDGLLAKSTLIWLY